MTGKRPSQRATSQPSPAAEEGGRLALLIIDEGPIRHAALKAYRKAERQVTRASAKIEAFESDDLPAFCRWEAQLFGPLMSEIRDITSALEEKAHLLALIDEEVFWTRCTRLDAYRRVLEARNNPSASLPGRSQPDADPADFADRFIPKVFGYRNLPPDFDIDVYETLSRREQKEIYEYYEDAALLFEMIHGIPAPQFEDLINEERERRQGRTTNRQIPPPEQEFAEIRQQRPDPVPSAGWARIKELYRTLVRRLHPDMGGAQTTRERELWQQVQDAYQSRDLDWLEAIHGRLEALHQGGATLSIQLLRRMTDELLNALHGLRAQLAKHRRHPGWKFHAKTAALERFEARRRRKLERDLAARRKKLDRIERVLTNLARRAAKPSKPQRRGSTQTTNVSPGDSP